MSSWLKSFKSLVIWSRSLTGTMHCNVFRTGWSRACWRRSGSMSSRGGWTWRRWRGRGTWPPGPPAHTPSVSSPGHTESPVGDCSTVCQPPAQSRDHVTESTMTQRLTCLNWLVSFWRGSVSNTSAMEDEQMSEPAPLLAPPPPPGPGLLTAGLRGSLSVTWRAGCPLCPVLPLELLSTLRNARLAWEQWGVMSNVRGILCGRANVHCEKSACQCFYNSLSDS